MPESSSLAPAVIDATDAEVLAPEDAPAELTVQQADQLERCQTHLQRLGKSIAARENGLIYLYIEAGFYLLKAQEIHRVPTVGTRSDGKFLEQQDSGFLRWLATPEVNLPKSSVYRYMQGAKNCGLTADSHIINLQAIKDTRKLNGQTLTALCRKPVDKTEKKVEITEVTDAEKDAERLADLKEAYRLSGQFLAEQVIHAQTLALLPSEEIEAYARLLADAARVAKEMVKKGKPSPVPAIPALLERSPATPPHLWRVGQRTGQQRWQIKKAPNWGVVHEVDSPEQAARWLSGHGVDLGTVDVLTVAPWPTLAAHLEAKPAEAVATPEPEADKVCTQEAIERGLWWYGWIGVRNTIMVKLYTGDMKEIVEGRAHPRVGKTFIGPFYAETLGDAEKIVREGNVDAKI